MSATDRRDFAHGSTIPNVPFGSLPSQEQQFKPPSGFGAINQDLLMQIATGSLGRPSVPGLPSNAALPSNFSNGILLSLLEQIVKRPGGLPGPSVQAPPVIKRPAALHKVEKFYVVREICRSAKGQELQVAVESGPINELDEAYAVLQHVKSRIKLGDTDPESIISLQEHVTIWSEPGVEGFFLVQLTPKEMANLTGSVVRQVVSVKPEQLSLPLPLEASTAPLDARYNKNRSVVRPRSSKGNCTFPSPQGVKRVAPIGASGHQSAFRPVAKQASGSITDRSVSTASVEVSEGRAEGSPTSRHCPAEDFSMPPATRPKDVSLLSKPHPASRHGKEPINLDVNTSLHAPPPPDAVGLPTQWKEPINLRSTRSRNSNASKENHEVHEDEAEPPAQLKALADAANHTTEASPEASDYSVNRSYHGEEEEGADAAPAVAAEAAAEGGEGDDFQEEELVNVVQGMMALAKQSAPNGTPPSSDGTRYHASSDDEFNVLKNAPKRRRSVYVVVKEPSKVAKLGPGSKGPSQGGAGGAPAGRKQQKMAVITCSAEAGWVPKTT